MQYRYLGKSGLQVSALSFGSWVTFGHQINLDVAYDCMNAAYQAGVNFFDNAEAYANGRSETVMGEVIKKAGWKRSDLVVSTKLFWGGNGPNDRGNSRKHILEGLDASLNRLQLSYVDLLFCHRPDLQTPIEETVRAMTHVINQGKVLYWGTSEWSAVQIMEAYAIARREHLIPPTMEQPQYNLFHRERVEVEYLPLYQNIGYGTTIWSPLASGILSGKYGVGMPIDSRVNLPGYEWLKARFESQTGRAQIALAQQLESIAADLGCTVAQLAIAWCLLNPHVSTVITGASRPSQVQENMQALAVLPKLTSDIVARIEGIVQNKPTPLTDFKNE
jgi:voltage-dependent potassium channel beta subunit